MSSQVDKNYAVFKKKLPDLLMRFRGKFILLSDEEVKGSFDTEADAVKAGQLAFGEGRFSVQAVSDDLIDLGFYSRM